MVDHTNDESKQAGGRRRFLAAFGAISIAIPEKWARPVVESVLLPAHAQTSPGANGDNGGGNGDENGNGDDGNGNGDENGNGDDNGNGNGCPDCDNPTRYLLKGETEGGLSWTTGVGANDCIKKGFDEQADGSDFGSLSGDKREVTFTLTKSGCKIVAASHKAGQKCLTGSISGECDSVVTFTADPKDISNFSIIVECCPTEE